MTDKEKAAAINALRELLGFIKRFDLGGDWCQDNYPAIKNARAVLLSLERKGEPTHKHIMDALEDQIGF